MVLRLGGVWQNPWLKHIKKKIQNSYIVDGDEVRKYISNDLGYNILDRKIQVSRLMGLGCLTINNGYFPIISSVTMYPEILKECNELGVEVIEIVASPDYVNGNRTIYKTEQNVVGKDLSLISFDTPKIRNDGDASFEQRILEYLEQISAD